MEIGQGSRSYGATLYQKVDFFDILGPHSQPSAPIDMTFCPAMPTQVPVGTAKFDLNRCNESPLRGEKPDFWPVSKNNTGSLPLRGNPAGNKHSDKHHIIAPTAGARRAHQKKCYPFFDPTYSFSYRGHGKFGLIY